MIISHKRKYIFVHIPKNAGTSVSEALGVNRSKIAVRINTASEHNSHWTLDEIYKNKDIDFNEYFKFAFTRNSWERMVSMFFFRDEPSFNIINYTPKFIEKHFPQGVPEPEDFPRFINHVYKFYKSGKHRNDLRARFLLPQYDFIHCDDISMDYIGEVASIRDDWKYIFNHIGLEEPVRCTNIRKHDHYSTYYNKQSIEQVNEIYLKDIEYFGYSFSSE
jgi:hypothetical protein